MDSPMFWGRFVLASLAVWRVTHLLASEDGPGNLIAGIRNRLGNSVLGSLMDCFGCLSLWISVPFAFLISGRPVMDIVLTWLALSGAAFLLERATSTPLMIERAPEATKGDSDHGMLR